MRNRFFCSEAIAGIMLLYLLVFAGYLLLNGLRGLAQAIDRSDAVYAFTIGAAVAVAYLSYYVRSREC